MSTNSDFDRIAAAWLAEGPSELADRVLDAVLDEVHLTHQRRRPPVPWRTPQMTFPLRLAAAAVIGVLVVGVIFLNLPGPSDTGTTGPSPSPSPTPSASPGADELDVSTWTAFTSPRYGFSARHPASFEAVPSGAFWRMPNATGNMFDGFHDEAAARWLNVASMLLPAGATQADWYDEYRRDLVEDDVPWEPETCFTSPEDWSSTTVDGHAADVRVGCEALEAFVFVAGRVYVFGAYGYEGLTPPTTSPGVSDELQDLFELWLTTITLDPASASELMPTQAPRPT